MEIRQLRYFISAANHLNFTKAAKECFIVQSSMTEQIANLENELGVKLFDRQRKGLALTEAGEFFLPKARVILSETERARKEMESFRAGYRSLLRIGYHGELFKADLIRTLKEYRYAYPTVRVALRQLPEKELLEGLRDGQFDLVVVAYQDGFEREREWMEWECVKEMGPMLVVAGDHPLAQRESITIAELEDLPFIGLGDHGREDIKLLAEENGEPQDVELAMDHTSNEILVASGYGVSLWAERLSREKREPDLKFVNILDYPDKKKFILAWRRGRLSPEGDGFCRRLQAEIGGNA